MKRSSLFTILLLVVILATGFIAGRASAAQPHMRSALDHLRAARHELDLATPDKGGHRAKAIVLVNDAITETEAGMEVGRR
ncbi:MAG TPA: hypothetical protein VLV78_09065 [Thermoanaerobaculia bacterium]|nr:hypothetical protein [Thermoanaerobaculia bacterium]